MTKPKSETPPPAPAGSKNRQGRKMQLTIFPRDWTAKQIADHLNNLGKQDQKDRAKRR